MKTWNDITIKQWQHITKVVDEQPDELLRWIEILPELEPITKDQIRQLSTIDFGKMVGPYKELLNQELEQIVRKKWKHDGRVFVCNHDLRKLTIERMEGLTSIQAKHFIDSSELSKMGKAQETYHIFQAIWWEDEGKGYDPANLTERAEYIRENMPMDIALPISNHFFQLWIDSLPAIQTYLKGKENQVGLVKGGTGIAS